MASGRDSTGQCATDGTGDNTTEISGDDAGNEGTGNSANYCTGNGDGRADEQCGNGGRDNRGDDFFRGLSSNLNVL